MKKNILSISLISAFLVFLSVQVSAGPWVQEKHQVQVAFTGGYTYFDTYLDSDGDSMDMNDEVVQFEAYYLYNAGIGKKRDYSIIIGVVSSDARSPVADITDNRNRGLTDTSIRYRQQIYSKNTTIALIGGLKIPGTYDENVLNAPGDHSLDVEAGMSIGEYYDERDMYWSADVLYRIRFGDTDDEAEFDFEIGRVFDRKWLLRGLLTIVEQTGGHPIEQTPLGGGSSNFKQLNEDRFRFGGGVSYQLGVDTSLGITYMETTKGSNTRNDRTYYLTYSIQNH
ncbi:MAG TPA: hypothetical protein PLN69_01925 [bacterium]|nr:hypothetical protein [bacterium]